MLERCANNWGMLAQWRIVGITHNNGAIKDEEANHDCFADPVGCDGIECAVHAQFPILEVWISMDDGQRQGTRAWLIFSVACLTA
jgi:hypothetical protein